MPRMTDSQHVWPRLTKPQADALVKVIDVHLRTFQRNERTGVLERAREELAAAVGTWEWHNQDRRIG